MTPPWLIIGVGNNLRGDDAAGLRAAEAIQRIHPPAVVQTADGIDALALIERWRGDEYVVLIDAVVSGAAAGTVHRLEAHRVALPAAWWRASSHLLSVAEAVELSRGLGRLPARLVIYGIEGAAFRLGAPMTPAVEAAIDRVVALVSAEIAGATELGAASYA